MKPESCGWKSQPWTWH